MGGRVEDESAESPETKGAPTMTSTLIVRDVTMAINGDRQSPVQPDLRLKERIAAVSEFEREFLEECTQVLSTTETSEETAPEVLEALFVLGMTHPDLLREIGLNAATVGRRFAARMERDGQPEVSLATLEFLIEEDPTNRGVQRDYAALMRRQGLVGELVQRHLAKAQELIGEGNNAEAIEVLREVLMLDRSRKDVARTIRDLRFQDIKKSQRRRELGRKLLMSIVAIASVTLIGLREYDLRERFNTMLVNEDRSIEAVRGRLASMESFIESYPVWLGAFDALNERSRLRVELERLEARAQEEAERLDEELRRRREEASHSRERGRVLTLGEDYSSALAEFERALELGGAEWTLREQTQRDIRAIREYIEEGR